MISWVVNADLELEVSLTVRGPSNRVRHVRAVIDTGFNGYLSLMPEIVADLGLVWKQTDITTLADGSETAVEVFEATVTWDDQDRAIFVDEANTIPLVGTGLLAGYALKTEFRPRGKVRIEPIRQRG